MKSLTLISIFLFLLCLGAMPEGLNFFENGPEDTNLSADNRPPRFSRFGAQKHLLVLSAPKNSADSMSRTAVRHKLEQIAVDRNWFLYQLSAGNELEKLDQRLLSEFDGVVLNQLLRSGLAPDQRLVLEHFEASGRPVLTVRGEVAASALLSRLELQ